MSNYICHIGADLGSCRMTVSLSKGQVVFLVEHKGGNYLGGGQITFTGFLVSVVQYMPVKI